MTTSVDIRLKELLPDLEIKTYEERYEAILEEMKKHAPEVKDKENGDKFEFLKKFNDQIHVLFENRALREEYERFIQEHETMTKEINRLTEEKNRAIQQLEQLQIEQQNILALLKPEKKVRVKKGPKPT